MRSRYLFFVMAVLLVYGCSREVSRNTGWSYNSKKGKFRSTSCPAYGNGGSSNNGHLGGMQGRGGTTYSANSTSSNNFGIGSFSSVNGDGIVDENLAGLLTAGEICDFSKFHLWNKYVTQDFSPYTQKVGVFPLHRYSVLVSSQDVFGIPFATVSLKSGDWVIWKSITDNTGKAELWIADEQIPADNITIEIEYGGVKQTIASPTPFFDGVNHCVLPVSCKPGNFPIEISFVVDATSSMDDEIQYLKTDLDKITNDIAITTGKEVSFSSVFYKAIENSDMVTSFPFTSDKEALQTFVKNQVANGGGTEAVAEGLHAAVNDVKWSDKNSFKLMFILLDESPGYSAADLVSMNKSLKEASEKGIRIVPVVCSGSDKSLEYLMRSSALLTNGTYLFLTDHSGIGNAHMTPTIDEYKVYTFQELMVNVIQRFTTIHNCDPNVISAMDENHIDYLFHEEGAQNRFTDEMLTEADTLSVVTDDGLVSADTNSTDTLTQPEETMNVFPNPLETDCEVEFSSSATGDLYLFDTNGKLIFTTKIENISRYHLDMVAWSKGTYYVIATTATNKWVKKVIKT
jgi:hypothetical protein